MLRKPEYQPCVPTRGTRVPTGAPTGFTIKHDGFRLIVQWQGNRVRLFTRRGHDWSDRYPLMVETALAKEDLSWSSARRK
jgi:bifunctional non-homologous end joining protein LigD